MCLRWFLLGKPCKTSLSLMPAQVLNYPWIHMKFLVFEAFPFVFRDATSHRLQCRKLLLTSCVVYFLRTFDFSWRDPVQVSPFPELPWGEVAVLFPLVLQYFLNTSFKNQLYWGIVSIKFTQFSVLINVCSHLITSRVMIGSISITTGVHSHPASCRPRLLMSFLSLEFFLFWNFM